MPSQQRQTVDALVEAFNRLDTDAIIAFRTPTCVRHFLPSSLKLPSQSNEAYLANLNSMKTLFTSFAITVNDTIEDLEKKKIVVFVSAKGDTPVGEYNNEYVWNIGFDESGEKISEWTEYVDAGMARDFYPKLMGEMKRRAEA
ncbi:hypothetical protein K491DRAFT_596438 [Lophiostoma macrostomum CBS 122681]|uniref:SnoaL-like domain-containing protein n=1 Tax=Lophiostoma macrostomum CBS 122681 TaxID=1314788 RepID=A0A6A6TBQ0_9PLEO|nr:hypothetical protein K491DRAFT_596438 [Lophiostoma macrostomum CBS 122681]